MTISDSFARLIAERYEDDGAMPAELADELLGLLITPDVSVADAIATCEFLSKERDSR